MVELGEGGFDGDVEGVERMFQVAVVFGLVVVNGEDGWWFCRRGVVSCVGGVLMCGEIGEVCFDDGVKCGRKNADVYVIDDVHGCARVVVWGEMWDEAMGVGKVRVVGGENGW